jgi:hypothetical protein
MNRYVRGGIIAGSGGVSPTAVWQQEHGAAAGCRRSQSRFMPAMRVQNWRPAFPINRGATRIIANFTKFAIIGSRFMVPTRVHMWKVNLLQNHSRQGRKIR